MSGHLLLAHVDAIIFDLRENGRGAPKMVAFVSSYLLAERTHLNDLRVGVPFARAFNPITHTSWEGRNFW
ncbi:MAG TPA: hypothetical protein VJN92_08045 [Candidatus Acidoferrum sp.]|nr:hypothetical protein [Candidatus Acidoferrum sp.]